MSATALPRTSDEAAEMFRAAIEREGERRLREYRQAENALKSVLVRDLLGRPADVDGAMQRMAAARDRLNEVTAQTETAA